MNKRVLLIALFSFVLLVTQSAFAQGETLVIGLYRDFGYAGFGNDIEGLFTVSADGPASLTRVDFYIDDDLISSDSNSPFRYQFTTKDFAPGEHRIHAIGLASDGTELASNEFVRVFLSADDARDKAFELVIPILAVVGVLILAGTGLPLLFSRGKPQPGKYGLSGGAICPKCGLPFPIHFFSFHAGSKNFERCPHCKKWVWVRKAKKEDLALAEARLRGTENIVSPVSTEDRLMRQIDDSRYEK